MTNPSLDISVNPLKRVQLVTVAGRVDSNTAPELDQTLKGLMNNNQYNLVIELVDVN
jgi:anti-anti-sigma regulatory factor